MIQNRIPRSWYLPLAGCLVLLVINHWVADWITRHTLSSKTNWLLSDHPQQTDCVVLGSSAAIASIEPALLAKELGCDVLMLAEEGAAYPEQSLIWDLFLERRRSKILLLEVDPWGLTNLGYSRPFHEYHYLPRLDHPRIQQAIAEENGPWLTAAWKYIPMLKFAQYNSQFGVVQLATMAKGTPFDPRRSGTNNKIATAEQLAAACKNEVMTDWEWSEQRIQGLTKIIDEAKEHGVQPILYYSPIYQGCRFAREEQLLDYYRDFAAKKSVPFLISEDAEVLGEASHFKDATHMNAQGAERFTQEIARQINKLSLLQKHP